MANKELYEDSIIKAEENIIKKQQFGFITDLCSIMKLMYSHILIHCCENVDIFSDEEKVVVDNLIAKTLI